MDLTQDRIAKLKELEKTINYEFKDKNLLNLAFIHTSFANENYSNKKKNNERLEYLGDAVLEMVFTEILYKNYKNFDEGYLTKLRSSLVREESFSNFARKINLQNYLLLGKGEEKTGGREKDSILSDAFEAFNGALYLDSGYPEVYEFIFNLIKNKLQDNEIVFNKVVDYKTLLQEYIHKSNKTELVYKLEKEEGPSHMKTFYINVYNGKKLIGEGAGRNKKDAEQMAAESALKQLGVIDK